jgi:arabinose-5-phosphate isomerase
MVKKTAGACMHPNPLTIQRQELAAAALQVMETRKVTSLLVTSADQLLEGVIHIHDLWQTQMF